MEKEEYIGISDARLKHMLGVARKCYSLAKTRGHGEDFCRKMWLVGYLHDIGYEFSENALEHPVISAFLLKKVKVDDNVVNAIKEHGKYTEIQSEEWEILNIADMTIDCNGNEVTVAERLEDIATRYGKNSERFLAARKMAYILGLTPTNVI